MNLDKKDLKIQALRERVAALTDDYENQVADLRVEVTVLTYSNNELSAKVKDLEEKLALAQEECITDDVSASTDDSD